MYKIEFLTPDGVVVGFFEVALNIPMSALSYWVEVAIKGLKGRSITHWQVRRPNNRILCQVKVQGF